MADENTPGNGGPDGGSPDANPGGERSKPAENGSVNGATGDFVFPVRESTRPALDRLQVDQRNLVYRGDRDRTPPLPPFTDDAGFASRKQLINWYQAAVVRTFGHVADVWPPSEIIRDVAMADALIGPPETKGQAWLKQKCIERVVLPACRQSYKHLRGKASERTARNSEKGGDDSTWQGISPENERHVAMRPGFTRLDATQSDVLYELWGGFADREELSEWIHSLHPATYGEWGGDDAAEMFADRYAVERFIASDGEPEDESVLYRERFAATELLPAFADAARGLRAGEETASNADTGFLQG